MVTPWEEMLTPFKRFGEGEIRSYDEYLRVAKEMQVTFPDGYLEPLAWIYDKPWDFLWSSGNGIMVSERIKERAEQKGLIGVSFELFKNAQVIMSSNG